MTATADLSLLRLALELAVDQLTQPEGQRLEVEGEMRSVTLPPLLTQLADALEEHSAPASASVAGSQLPLRVPALSLLNEIDRHCTGRRPRLARVRAWSAAWHSTTSLTDMETVRDLAEGWVARARAVLDPTPPWVLRGKRCPACLRTTTTAVDAAGEEMQRPPLEVDRTTGNARCVADDCGARWDAHNLEHLADQIDRVEQQIADQTKHETLAHTPEDTDDRPAE